MASSSSEQLRSWCGFAHSGVDGCCDDLRKREAKLVGVLSLNGDVPPPHDSDCAARRFFLVVEGMLPLSRAKDEPLLEMTKVEIIEE